MSEKNAKLELTKHECVWLQVALALAAAEFRRNGQYAQYLELEPLSQKLVEAEREAGYVRAR